MFALTALGNRTWGYKYHFLGAVMMGEGLWLGRSYSLWALPVLILACFVFRVWSSHPWLHLYERIGTWKAAILRTLWVMVVAGMVAYLDHNIWPLVRGLALVVLIPAIYYLAAIQNKIKDGIALSEFVSGAGIGLI